MKYKILNLYERSNIDPLWEGQFIEICKVTSSKKLIIGNIYRPPNNTTGNYNYFTEELSRVLAILTKSRSDVIIAGDFNIDMLKINENNHVSNFFNTVTSHTFFPKTTLPTRFSDRNCTLIDNFLCKLSPTIINSKAGILMNNLSDHLPYAINIPNLCNYQRASRFIHVKTNDINSVTNFKMEIINANIYYDKLNHDVMGDPNDNYNIVETIIQDNISTNFIKNQMSYKWNNDFSHLYSNH